MSTLFENQVDAVRSALRCDDSFDLIERNLLIAGRGAVIYYLNGLSDSRMMEKLLSFFLRARDESVMKNADAFLSKAVPYVEISRLTTLDEVVSSVLAGQPCLVADWLDNASSASSSFPTVLCFDSRSYPQRSEGEAEDDRVLRGSKDGFLETVILNLALMRRRIRDPNFLTKALTVGSVTKSDVVICYLDTKVDHTLLKQIEDRLSRLKIDALTMNQQTLIEALAGRRWLNPFPKVKYTERPDVAAAVCMKGNIVILVDNAPSALLIPTSIFDVLDEADDYYFPPLTGTYIRISRYLISSASVLLTPLWLLCLQYPEFVPQALKFVVVKDAGAIDVFWQLLMMEICIDGLRLAALHTPNSLTSALGIIGGIAFSQFAVDAGWFTTEATLYMAFVTIANYSLPNFELGYSLKFLRLMLLVLTRLFRVFGFVAGIILIFIMLLKNRTISGKSFLYPLVPFDVHGLKNAFFRFRK